MVADGRASLERSGVAFTGREAIVELDMSYLGQTHTVAVPIAWPLSSRVTSAFLSALPATTVSPLGLTRTTSKLGLVVASGVGVAAALHVDDAPYPQRIDAVLRGGPLDDVGIVFRSLDRGRHRLTPY